MPQRHCRVCNGWHDLSERWPEECRGHFRHVRGPASEYVAAPMVISDNIELRSHANGEMYTSKRAYYRDLNRSGHSIVDKHPSLEEFSEKPNRPEGTPKDVGRDVAKAWDTIH